MHRLTNQHPTLLAKIDKEFGPQPPEEVKPGTEAWQNYLKAKKEEEIKLKALKNDADDVASAAVSEDQAKEQSQGQAIPEGQGNPQGPATGDQANNEGQGNAGDSRDAVSTTRGQRGTPGETQQEEQDAPQPKKTLFEMIEVSNTSKTPLQLPP